MRRLIAFPCAGETLLATLDEASGDAGLLIVSGGNEIRAGAHRGMAELAAALAAAGTPVFRFDRRGIGDSTGGNLGWAESAPDLAAAAATFVAETGIRRLVGFGNCDAATALATFHASAGLDALVLANPWIGGTADALPAAAAIRARYAAKLRQPRELLRLLRGGVSFGKLASGLRKAIDTDPEERALVDQIAAGIATLPTTILLAERDNTAVAFAAAWARLAAPPPAAIERLASASHSFAAAADADWLRERVLAAVARYSAA